jgi:6-pyruvoyl-tetrahydropterin synthase
MSTISVRSHFAAGHRILGLTGEGKKCRNIHGHTFTVQWTIDQDSSTEDPVEFGALKKRLKDMIKATYDHQFILDKSDDFQQYLSINNLRHRTVDGPPTTERIAEDIANETMRHFTERYDGWGAPLAPHAKLLSVELGEGPENTATWLNPAFVKVWSGGKIDLPPLTGLSPGLETGIASSVSGIASSVKGFLGYAAGGQHTDQTFVGGGGAGGGGHLGPASE